MKPATCLTLAACLFGAHILNAAERPQVAIDTNLGVMVVELWPDQAPLSVDNFLKLVDDGFYEGTIFHRVIAGFMIQGGGYGAGMNYRPAPRKVANESANGASNLRWTIALARHGDPHSADSQFYINTVDNAHLDAKPGAFGYTVFGKLIAGEDVALAIERAETALSGDRVNVPLKPVTILSMRRMTPSASTDDEERTAEQSDAETAGD